MAFCRIFVKGDQDVAAEAAYEHASVAEVHLDQVEVKI